jgi:hypothetical protein
MLFRRNCLACLKIGLPARHAGIKHHELQSIGRFWYQEIGIIFNSERTVTRWAPNFRTHSNQRRALRRQRCAPRPHQRVLPQGPGRQVRAPRGALRPRARRDRRCNPKSPLELELIQTHMAQKPMPRVEVGARRNLTPGKPREPNARAKLGQRRLLKGRASIFLTPPCSVAAFGNSRAPHRGTSLGPFVCGARACSLCSYPAHS